MMQKVLVLLLIWLLLSSIVTSKTSRILSPDELRRRARRSGSARPNKLYSMFSYSSGLKLTTWLVGSLAFTTLALRASDAGWLALGLLVIVCGWLIFAWHPKRAAGWYWKYCALLAAPLSKFLSFIQPLISRIERLPAKLWPINIHSGIYEEEDLLSIIKNQKDQPENRIPETDLRIAYGALAFGGKKVGDVMTPRRKIKMVAANEDIVPHLLDELHASGFSRFPVVSELTKSASVEVIGTLYLRDLVNHAHGGKVSDVMERKTFFINEASTLRQALDAFIKTRRHLLVVVNNFEEIVGVVSIEDVIEQIFGTNILDEFDNYEDLREVAAMEAAKERRENERVKTPEQSAETVVE